MPLQSLAGATIIVIATFFIYAPALTGGFLLDDDLLLTDSSLIKASDGLYRFWCTTEPPDYWPLSNSSLWIEWRLWGAHPTGYHVTNVVLHIIASLLIWRILVKLSIPGAFLAALLFAVHPVNVESIAWIAQRKDAMAVPFLLLSALCFIHAEVAVTRSSKLRDPPAIDRWYCLSLAAFVAAMLSKGSVAILPVLLLGIVWWLRPLTRWDALRLSPFFVVAAALTWVNMWFQTRAVDAVTVAPNFLEHLLGAGAVIWFYLDKALLPIRLAFIYPKWAIAAGDLIWWLPLAAAVAVTAILWRYRKGWARSLLFAWGLFCTALVPVMGFTRVGFMRYSLVADHYQHVAVISIVASVAAAWTVLCRRTSLPARRVANSVAIIAVAALAVLAHRQSDIYRDATTLYRATLERNPECSIAHYNLANVLDSNGERDDAMVHYQRAVEIDPNHAEAHNNVGPLLVSRGRIDEAIAHYQQALKLRPHYAQVHYNFAIALNARGQSHEAITHYEKALQIQPNYADAHNNLGLLMATRGQLEEAMMHYDSALRSCPNHAQAHSNLGMALAARGRMDEAVAHFQEAVRLRPKDAEVHSNLGNAMAAQGRSEDAIHQFRKALELSPTHTQTLNDLAWLLATCPAASLRNGAEAVALARRAEQLAGGDSAEVLDTLAAAYAEAGQFRNALVTARKALELATKQDKKALADSLKGRISVYETNRAYHREAQPSAPPAERPGSR
ncbi:MAG: tetratricopeptide repeat protein [Planctomycetaceae bacterium]|nr:tetratricopeptide repeat protein [Planctomycetaceae bacterium]